MAKLTVCKAENAIYAAGLIADNQVSVAVVPRPFFDENRLSIFYNPGVQVGWLKGLELDFEHQSSFLYVASMRLTCDEFYQHLIASGFEIEEV